MRYIATLLLFIASWKDLRRTLIMTFGDRTSRLRTLRILNEIGFKVLATGGTRNFLAANGIESVKKNAPDAEVVEKQA